MSRTGQQSSASSIHEILTRTWGYSSFRPLQEQIIESVIAGKDCLALLPTGGGKSICYQVPGLYLPGLCLVISPLIALMKDQVEQLRKRNITAFAIYSGMSRKEVINTLQVAGQSNCKFLYVSPERLETNLFKEYLPGLGISMLAVDEAHCISQWGYDFRPPYLRIAALRAELPGVPILALTASATPEVQDDIMSKLEFAAPTVFRQSFERPNLSYSLFHVTAKINKIVEILQQVKGSSLVYCRSRRRTKEISDLLQMHGITADYYHAGLSQEQRSSRQEAWIKNEIRTMACTNAFGMGIDKPDVRVVIHADLPDCLENYYQEAGRAGRDGKRAYAVLLVQSQEPEALKAMPETRFPPITRIREIYQHLMNYLQLPIGSGEGKEYPFDITRFLSSFKLKAAETWAALQTLEQEDVLSYTDAVFTHSTIQFTCNKELLREFEQLHPELDPLIKALLRAYEGIFDFPARVQEKNLAWLIHRDQKEVIEQLKQLQSFRIIQYDPPASDPLLFFPRNRVAAEDLYIDTHQYQQRKSNLEKRIKKFLDYLNDTAECRSRFIASYFGDSAVPVCGICDNCLKKKREGIGAAELEEISLLLLKHLHAGPKAITELLSLAGSFPKEKIWQVLEYLQAEQKIMANELGELQLPR